VKVVAYEATQNAGKSYFSNFRLFRVEAKPGEQKAASKP
jgi:hypothetical protein